MGKKMKLPFLTKNNSYSSVQAAKPSWPWPSCHQPPRTLSFRTDDDRDDDHNENNSSSSNNNNNNLFKTVCTAYFDAINEAETPKSWFTNSTESASFSTAVSDYDSGVGAGIDSVETVIRGLKSTERLFFEPGETSSILEEATKPNDDEPPFKESVVLSMESQDPYIDFRKSMEEMVEAQGLKDWEALEQLLCWYLKANGKYNHGYIVGAFVDLLVKLNLSSPTSKKSFPSCSNCSQLHSPSSPLSFYTSSSSSSSSSSCEDNSSATTPCVSSLQAEEQETDNSHCLSSLSESDQKDEIIIKDAKDDEASSSSLSLLDA